MKAKLLIPTILAVIVIGFISTCYYVAYHPDIRLSVSERDGVDVLLYTMSGSNFIPISREIEETMMEISDWNNEVITFLNDNAKHPRDIKPSAEVVGGQTILRYEGYYTTENGEKVDYFEEKAFDIVIKPDKELLR